MIIVAVLLVLSAYYLTAPDEYNPPASICVDAGERAGLECNYSYSYVEAFSQEEKPAEQSSYDECLDIAETCNLIQYNEDSLAQDEGYHTVYVENTLHVQRTPNDFLAPPYILTMDYVIENNLDIEIINLHWFDRECCNIHDAMLVMLDSGYFAEPDLHFVKKYWFEFNLSPCDNFGTVTNRVMGRYDITHPGTSQLSGSERGNAVRISQNGKLSALGSVWLPSAGHMAAAQWDEHGLQILVTGGDTGDIIYTPVCHEEYRYFPCPVRELTTTQWYEYGLQIFILAGDVTIIGAPGNITRIPAFHEDTFYFPLTAIDNANHNSDAYILHEFEYQYIMHHELRNSALWRYLY